MYYGADVDEGRIGRDAADVRTTLADDVDRVADNRVVDGRRRAGVTGASDVGWRGTHAFQAGILRRDGVAQLERQVAESARRLDRGRLLRTFDRHFIFSHY